MKATRGLRDPKLIAEVRELEERKFLEGGQRPLDSDRGPLSKQ